MKPKYKVISISKTGVSADFADHIGRYHLIMHKSYPSREDIDNLEEEGYIIDKRPALELNLRVALACPILNINKPFDYVEGVVRPVSKKPSIFHPKSFNNLNMKEVGVGAFVQYWREAGAKIGRKLNNRIIWSQKTFNHEDTQEIIYYGEA